MQNITESMAGRAAILQLLPFSLAESNKVDLLSGGYPEALARQRDASLWFASYVQTYLERGVRSLSAAHDLPTFRRFMALAATRHGSLINMSDLAAPLGISASTIGRWLDILERDGGQARVDGLLRRSPGSACGCTLECAAAWGVGADAGGVCGGSEWGKGARRNAEAEFTVLRFEYSAACFYPNSKFII